MKNEEELKKVFADFTQARRDYDAAKSALKQAEDALKRQEGILAGTSSKFIVAKKKLDDALKDEPPQAEELEEKSLS
jgi:hypothetical protein